MHNDTLQSLLVLFSGSLQMQKSSWSYAWCTTWPPLNSGFCAATGVSALLSKVAKPGRQAESYILSNPPALAPNLHAWCIALLTLCALAAALIQQPEMLDPALPRSCDETLVCHKISSNMSAYKVHCLNCCCSMIAFVITAIINSAVFAKTFISATLLAKRKNLTKAIKS